MGWHEWSDEERRRSGFQLRRGSFTLLVYEVSGEKPPGTKHFSGSFSGKTPYCSGTCNGSWEKVKSVAEMSARLLGLEGL